MAQKYIIAMPTADAVDAQGHNLGGSGLDNDRKVIQRKVDQRKGDPGPEHVMLEYTSIDDLVTKINDDKLKKGDVLQTLEIHAHGSPASCGGINADIVGDVGQKLMTIKWDDKADFYLAGCNTGLTDSRAHVTESIAKRLAAAMRFESAVTQLGGVKFEHKISVWGTKGYMITFGGAGGTHMEVGMNTTSKIAKGEPDAPSYDGAEDEGGQKCWIENPNWT